MTTVVFDGDYLAVDSLASDGNGVVDGEVNKIHTLFDGSTLVGAGEWSDIHAVIEWINDGAHKEGKPELNGHPHILHINHGAYDYYDSPKLVKTPATIPVFMGSGYEIAKGAYYSNGRRAGDAVKIACMFDVHSGGEVKVKSFCDDGVKNESNQ